jgi:predicted MFS family arabinose efflux permease
MSDPPPRVSRNPLSRSNPLAPIYLCVFLFSAGEQMLHVLVPAYVGIELEARPAMVGAVLSVFAVASLLARFPTGLIYTVDRAWKLLVVGGALSAGAFAVAPLIKSPGPFAVLMAVDGFGWSIATTAQLALLVAARPAGMSTASAMGWYSGFNGLGNTVAGAGAGLLGDTFGFGPSFLVLAAVPAVATVIMVALMPWGKLGSGADAAVESQTSAGSRFGARDALRSLTTLPVVVWAGVLVMVYINLLSGVVNTFHPLLAIGAGLSLTQVGILRSCRSWASSSVRLGSGVLFARTDGKWMTTPLVVLGAVAVAAVPSVASSFVLQVPLFLAGGLSRGLLRVTGSTEAFDGATPERQQGMIAALLQGGLDLGKLLGPLVAGVVAEVWGLSTMFRVVPLAMLVAYLPLDVAARRRMGRPELERA